MKRMILILTLGVIFSQFNFADTFRPSVSVGYFYSSLEPYGEWIEIDYDVYAWRPTRVGYNWQPYSDGRWVWTSDGWFWDSYEPFGWATFHYGRWYFDDYYGWLWLPGNEWAPAWVEWRYDNDYIGWAPLPPYAEFRVNVGIHFTITWRSNYKHWHYVSFGHFCSPHVHNYYISQRNVYVIHSHTKYRTNYTYVNGRIYNGGVERTIVETRSKTKIRSVEIERTTDIRSAGTRSSDNKVRAYSPSRSELERSSSRTSYNIVKSERKSSLRTSDIPESARSSSRISTEQSRQSERTVPQTSSTRNSQERNSVSTEKNQSTRSYSPERSTNSGSSRSYESQTRSGSGSQKTVAPNVKSGNNNSSRSSGSSSRSGSSGRSSSSGNSQTRSRR